MTETTTQARMEPGEFRAVTHFLGMSVRDLTRYFHVESDEIRAWLDGSIRIPDSIAAAIEQMESETSDYVADLVELLDNVDDDSPVVVIHRNDHSFRAAHPELRKWTAGWYLNAVMRAATEVGDVRLVNAEDAAYAILAGSATASEIAAGVRVVPVK